MKRPYKVPGFGWILAAIALVVAVLGLVGVFVAMAGVNPPNSAVARL